MHVLIREFMFIIIIKCVWVNEDVVSMHVNRCMQCVLVHAVKVPVCVDACIQCVSVRARPAAARVTLVNIKAASCFAELTNLSHPTPRAAFETHTAGLHSAL